MAEAEVPIKNQKRFNFLTWEIDTTGKLLCDEFFHMTCLSGSNKFDVYVMPHRDISHYASLKYQIVTSNMGLYRDLRRRQTGKIIKTKTEIYGLIDFLSWLKISSELPVVLMTYEPYEFAPYVLIQALRRYGMLEEFKELVHGFAYSFQFIKKKCKKSTPTMNLRSLAKILLNKSDVKRQDSYSRALLINEILLHLCYGDSTNEAADLLASEMQKYLKTVTEVEHDLELRTNKFVIQSSLKPIFSPYLKGQKNKSKVLNLRNFLLENNMNYEKLESMWKENGRDKFKNDMNELLNSIDEKCREDLIAILLLYFESLDSKVTSKPISVPQGVSRPRNDRVSKKKEKFQTENESVTVDNHDSTDNIELPDNKENSSGSNELSDKIEKLSLKSEIPEKMERVINE